MEHLKNYKTYLLGMYVYLTIVTILNFGSQCAFGCSVWHQEMEIFSLKFYRNGYLETCFLLLPSLIVAWLLVASPNIIRKIIITVLGLFSVFLIISSYLV